MTRHFIALAFVVIAASCNESTCLSCECTVDADCLDPAGPICNVEAAICEASCARDGCECDNDSDCDEGLTCADGRCACDVDEDCADDLRCVDSRCTASEGEGE